MLKKFNFVLQEIFRCIKRGILLRQAKGRTLQLTVSSDESLLCCLVNIRNQDYFFLGQRFNC